MAHKRPPDPQTAALAAQIGRRVRALRRERGLSQEALGQLVGLHRIYIGEFERGKRQNPTLANLRSIALALGVPVRDLFPVGDGMPEQ
jgi:transcriptional regulator with XRE-family HTH domain